MGSNEHRKAFEICRTNKLDLNLIFDLDPEGFISNSLEILTRIEKPDYLNIFLA